ncbi:hypothetical protein [Microbacterium sp. PMB16]|uniref:hypothetical protein n=1 Tax=Microbacterium sp. PMB16 TaxID=3120157 RepID=UPI003F4C72A8
MRSDRPMPGNPWPHDMMLTVEDRPSALLELLWLREAHDLHPEGDGVPPLVRVTPAPAERVVDDAVRAEWERAWPRVWEAVVAHAGKESDPRLFERLRETADGSPERASLLTELMGPGWGDEFGRDVFDDRSYRDWVQQGHDAVAASRRVALEDTPERRDLEALIPAWRAGLTKIVTIPCRGDHDRRIAPNALLVTDETRADSGRYRRALTAFV